MNIFDWRSELKFDVSTYNDDQILLYLKTHPFIFREHFQKRSINNIYFDKFNYQFFKDNVDGISDRLKTRIRWYGDTFTKITNPKLELKIKSRDLGRKEHYDIKKFILKKNSSKNEIYKFITENSFLNLKVKKILLKTTPVLVNSYKRRYFVSACRKFRITFDTNLVFYDFSNINFLKHYTNIKILEIKFLKNEFVNFQNLTQHFPFRINKSSKYVTGVNLLKTKPKIY